MSSSDSSDEENLKMLREAADSQFINDSMFNGENTEPESEQVVNEKLPSLRPNRNEKDQYTNVFKVTPEFQQHVSKQLMAQLDKRIEFVENTSRRKRKKVKPAVKLLKSSSTFLEVENSGEAAQDMSKFKNARRCEIKRRKVVEDFNSGSEEEKCKSVAVTPEDVLSKKEVQTWSNRSKAEVFEYKKIKNCVYEYVQPKFK